jgi:hypothetical protein
MRSYLTRTPTKEYPDWVRLVHNFYPGAHDDDPGRKRLLAHVGFRAWATDEPSEQENACYCGWLGREHFGTVGYVDVLGQVHWRDEAPVRA